MIDTLAEWNVEGARSRRRTRRYVNARQEIAALGIRARRGLRVPRAGVQHRRRERRAVRHQPLRLRRLRRWRLSDLGGPSALEAVKLVLDRLAAQFGLAMESGPSPDLAAVASSLSRMRREGAEAG